LESSARTGPRHRGFPGRRICAEPSDLKVLLRAVVPGWPQAPLGPDAPGKMVLLELLALLAIRAAVVRTNWAASCWGLAFALHTAAAIDIVSATFADFSTRASARSPRSQILIVAIYFAGRIGSCCGGDPVAVAQSSAGSGGSYNRLGLISYFIFAALEAASSSFRFGGEALQFRASTRAVSSGQQTQRPILPRAANRRLPKRVAR